jgi:hypothetical protein
MKFEIGPNLKEFLDDNMIWFIVILWLLISLIFGLS